MTSLTVDEQIASRAVQVYGAQQDPWELSCVLTLLRAKPPGLILEIGCWSGGSLWAWKSTGAEVIGLTLPAHANILRPHGAEIILADSTAPDTEEELRTVLAGRVPGMVFIDGDHEYGPCASDFELAMRVAPGAVIGFHDITMPGPRKVWDDTPAGLAKATFIHHPENMGTGLVFTE